MLAATPRLHAIHATRGLAAVAVLIWHYQHFYDGLAFERGRQPHYVVLRSLYEHGHRAVPLFWCLSGVVFMHVYGDRRLDLPEFWRARFARLYPLHFVTFLAVAMLQVMSRWLGGRTRIYSNNDLPHALLNLGFVQSWGLERGFSFNGPSWSVSVELVAYLTFASAAWTGVTRSTTGLIALAFLLVPSVDAETPRRLLQCVGLFFVGALVERSVSRRSPVCALAIAVICTLTVLINRPGRSYILVVIALVAGARLLDTRLRRGSAAGGLLGDASYGMFLWHVPVQIAALIIYEALGIQRSIVGSPIHLVVYVAVAIAAGWASHRFFEEPARRRIVRRGGRRDR